MKIVTTPMCEEILHLAGIENFAVIKDLDSADADIAVVLTETKTNLRSIKIKLNTFLQIEESIRMVSEIFGTEPLDYKVEKTKDIKMVDENRKIKVKAHSNFLKEIVEDLGFTMVNEDYDFVVYPDYMKDDLKAEIKNKKAVEIPSHKNAPNNPLKRAEIRYNILERNLCMKP